MRRNHLIVQFVVPLLVVAALLGTVAASSRFEVRGPHFRAAQQSQLAKLVDMHQHAKAQLPAGKAADLDRLARHVRQVLFSRAAPPDLLSATEQIVALTIPALTAPQSRGFAIYALNEIASEGTGAGGTSASGLGDGGAIGSAEDGDSQSALFNATKQMQETQMSFNLQYLQLQSQMQNDNRHSQWSATS